MDEGLTEDEFYSGPLRGIFAALERRNTLRHVQTLILDGLSVPADLVQEILSEDRFRSIRILSVKEATHLNEKKLMQALRYAVRPTRPPEMPRLKGLYVFGQIERPRKSTPSRIASNVTPTNGVTNSEGAQIGAVWNERSHQALNPSISRTDDVWYQSNGRMMKTTPGSEWAETLKACEGIIAFDAILCRGPRHDAETAFLQAKDNGWLPPAVANVALGSTGCAKCGTSPEEPGIYKQSPADHLPLLNPPATRSSLVLNSQAPILTSGSSYPPLYARCQDCLRGRWCERCVCLSFIKFPALLNIFFHRTNGGVRRATRFQKTDNHSATQR